MLETSAEAYHIVFLESDFFVEGDGLQIVPSNLNVDLGTPQLREPFPDVGHETPAVTLATAGRIHREIVDPSSMAFVSGHCRGDNRAVHDTDEKQLSLDPQLPGDVLTRIVPWTDQAASLPEIYHGIFVGFLEGSDLHTST